MRRKMKREQAKMELMSIYGSLSSDKQIAIDTLLEQEPCEDTISRSDMLDAIGHGTTYTSEELQRIIQGLPPVNPKPTECEDKAFDKDLCNNCLFGEGTEYCRKRCPYESKTEQEPCEDAISRDAIIAWFCNQRCGCGCVDRKSCPILVGIRELPSVTPKSDEQLYKNGFADGYEQGHKDAEQKSESVTEFADRCRECGARYGELLKQKSGKWINDKNDIPICSRCGYIPQYDRAIDDYEYSNYCPLCGAKMESEE